MRKEITQKIRSKEGLYPVALRDFTVEQKRESQFCYLTVFSLRQTVLLRCVRARDVLLDSLKLKVVQELGTYKLTASIALKGTN